MSRWGFVEFMIQESKKDVKVLPVNEDLANLIMGQFNFSDENALGAVIANTGGIVVDNWIRIYGAGEIDLIMRNQSYTTDKFVVAEDIVGGLFFLLEDGTIGYFSPLTLQIQHFDMRYEDLLTMLIYSDNTLFYQDLKWAGWKQDIENVSYDQGIMFYPMLWAGGDKETSSKKAIPMIELVNLTLELLEQSE